MFCAQCGQRCADGAKFCSSCGAATASAEQPSAEPARPPDGGSGASPALGAALGPGATAGGASAGPGFDATQATELARGIFARVKNILLSPATEWPVIAAEPATPSTIYLRYVAPLVAIGVIATFLGHTLIGVPVPLFGSVRVGVVAGLTHGILMFALSFLGVFVIAHIVDALATTFGGQKDSLAALKVTAYSYTPAWVAGVLNLLPVLGILASLVGLYGLYLLYLGLPVLMRAPKEKAVGYTIVTVLCAIVLWVVIAALSTCIIGASGLAGIGTLGRLGTHDERAATTDAAGALSRVFGGSSDADRARVTQAMTTLEKFGALAQQADKAAATTGSPGAKAPSAGAVDVTTAMNAVGQIMTGGKEIRPVDFHELKAMLPSSLPGMQRNEASGQSGEAMGMKGSSATARYSDGAQATIHIEIIDLGSLSGLAALAGKFDPSMEKETATGYERTRRVGEQLVHERYDRSARSGEVGVIIANRFSVTVAGSGVDPGTLTVALKAIDLASLAAMRTATR
jgi:hypothetical protein